ncbi:MAG: extracellular solute-binding protein [Candidatus Thiodiazotropha sp. (ex Lucinoma kastoroae)]|nr:extracellular solute-binding protein [Candidatus Thiodiazotropha sp. (ex Lucinoma kastoroae)]
MNPDKKPFFLGAILSTVVIVSIFIWMGQTPDGGDDLASPASVSEAPMIRIAWADWAPSGVLQELSQDFTRETGIRVEVERESWATFQAVAFKELAHKGRRYDMVIGDSQWLGRGSSEGHYIELTKWMKARGVDRSMTATSITGYAEFPKGSGHLWAVPVEGDAMGFSYRRDLFEDQGEQAAFKARYGYELDVPVTWVQLKDIAEFFYRPEQDFYGVLIWVEPQYDGLTMGLESLIWAWGASLGDTKRYRVQGILNSKQGVEALEFYHALNQFNNPKWRDYYLDAEKNSNQPMMSGNVAMAMGYFAINTELLDPGKNPYADRVGFFANPKGPGARVSSLGGQGISLISYSKKKELSFRFLEWFIREDVQKKWAAMGGLSCNKRVLASKEFLDASPINRPFKESIEMAQDFWAVPEYEKLLSISQKHWSAYINDGTLSASEAMNKIADEWESVFELAGYYKE